MLVIIVVYTVHVARLRRQKRQRGNYEVSFVYVELVHYVAVT